jgi:hypothetical protein
MRPWATSVWGLKLFRLSSTCKCMLKNSKIILKRNSKEDTFSAMGCIAWEIKWMDQLQSTRLIYIVDKVALNMGDISETVTRWLILLGRTIVFVWWWFDETTMILMRHWYTPARPRKVCSSPSLLVLVTCPGLKMEYSLHLFVHASWKKSLGGPSRSQLLRFLRVSMIRAHVGSCCWLAWMKLAN